MNWDIIFSVDNKVDLSLVEISKQLGLSVDVVNKSLKYLVKHELFKKELIYKTKNWDRNSYKATVKLTRDLLHVIEVKNLPQIKLVQNLLRQDNKQNSRKTKNHNLTIPNRLLLIILLCHSDKYGVVGDLSLTKLANIFGGTKSSVSSRIILLKKRDYIRTYISGVSGKNIFKRSTSIIILNLKHNAFGQDAAQGLTILLSSINIGSNVSEAVEMYSVANFLLNPKNKKFTSLEHIWQFENNLSRLYFTDSRDEFRHIVPFFNEPSFRLKMQSFLQVKINQYASILLSIYWSELINKESVYDKSLKSIILKDTLGELHHPRADENIFPNNKSVNLLVKFIFDAADFLAKRLQAQLTKLEKYSPSTMDYIIFPSVEPLRRNIAIESFYKDAEPYKRNRIIQINVNYALPEQTTVNMVKHLTKEDEYRYGLLSKVEPKIIKVDDKNKQI